MKVTLIPERCIACGLCQTYSDLFDYHDNGIVKFYQDDDCLEKEVTSDPGILEAIKNCPTRALLKDQAHLD
ncbi:ferredoxin [Streptococcus panodentis]